MAHHNSNEVDKPSAGYETVTGELDSLVPGYERVAGGQTSDSEPNYEELRPQDSKDSTYATVNKKRRKISQFSNPEPDYASLSRKDPGYERVEGFDPNYESVSRDSDPNYESVEREEPPYERVEAGMSNYIPLHTQDNGHIQSEDVYSQVNKQRTLR